jgi:hypothetical protein
VNYYNFEKLWNLFESFKLILKGKYKRVLGAQAESGQLSLACPGLARVLASSPAYLSRGACSMAAPVVAQLDGGEARRESRPEHTGRVLKPFWGLRIWGAHREGLPMAACVGGGAPPVVGRRGGGGHQLGCRGA